MSFNSSMKAATRTAVFMVWSLCAGGAAGGEQADPSVHAVRLVANFDMHLDRFADTVEEEMKRQEQNWMSLTGECDHILERLELPLSHDDWEDTSTTTTEFYDEYPPQSDTEAPQKEQTKHPTKHPEKTKGQAPAKDAHPTQVAAPPTASQTGVSAKEQMAELEKALSKVDFQKPAHKRPGAAAKSSPEPLATTTVCADGNAQCAGWAWNGECKKNSEYMLAHCKMSCHVCQVTAESSNTTPPGEDHEVKPEESSKHSRHRAGKEEHGHRPTSSKRPRPASTKGPDDASHDASGENAASTKEVVTREYNCRPGQGEYGVPHLRISGDNDKVLCGKLCDLEPGCAGFDYMSNPQSDACRLYVPNQPRRSGGPGHRKYCKALSPSTRSPPHSTPSPAAGSGDEKGEEYEGKGSSPSSVERPKAPARIRKDNTTTPTPAGEDEDSKLETVI